ILHAGSPEDRIPDIFGLSQNDACKLHRLIIGRRPFHLRAGARAAIQKFQGIDADCPEAKKDDSKDDDTRDAATALAPQRDGNRNARAPSWQASACASLIPDIAAFTTASPTHESLVSCTLMRVSMVNRLDQGLSNVIPVNMPSYGCQEMSAYFGADLQNNSQFM